MLSAYSDLGLQALLRHSPADFRVIEELGVEPSGDGEHIMLWVEKCNANTEWVAKKIANYAGVSPRDVSFAGVKDRKAITQQWFSVWIKNKPEPDWLSIVNDEFSILQATRHARKIKRGTLKGNYFELTLRELEYDASVSELEQSIAQRIELITQQGVPNYFGEQRFGIDNINKAKAWFCGEYRAKKSEQTWLLSSARSYIFNQVLSARIQQQNWQTVLEDDVLMLDGSHSMFTNDDSQVNQQRYQQQDLHITGPLYGDKLITAGDSLLSRAQLEAEVYQDNRELCVGLDKQGLRADRRPLRLIPKALSYRLDLDNQFLVIKFYLPAGAYATTLLKELVHC